MAGGIAYDYEYQQAVQSGDPTAKQLRPRVRTTSAAPAAVRPGNQYAVTPTGAEEAAAAALQLQFQQQMQQQQNLMTAAELQNEMNRYDALTQEAESNTAFGMGQLDTNRARGITDIGRQYDALGGATTRRLGSRGLGRSGIFEQVKARQGRDRLGALGGLEDRVSLGQTQLQRGLASQRSANELAKQAAAAKLAALGV